jgi:hypothetical protein
MTYTWYKTPDAVNNTIGDDAVAGNADTLSFTATADAYYYCKVTNGGGSTYSNVANLAIKRKVAHWTLNELVSGQYADSSGETPSHNADPNGTPVTFVDPGMVGKGILVDGKSFGKVGTWNPSQYSGKITISLWARWTGPNGDWQGLISKRNTWAADTMMWQVEAQPGDAGELQLKSTTSTISSPILPTNEWEYVAVTFDGTTATIYRNGVNAGSGAFAFDTGTGTNLTIGASQLDTAGIVGSLFNGALDDVQIYNYALSNIEVADLYLAVRDEFVCINEYASQYDFNKNCIVDLGDFVALAQQWLNCGRYPDSTCN